LKWIQDIKKILEKYFTITNIESDHSAAAFFVKDDPKLIESFEEMRLLLKEMDFLAALRREESRASVKEMIIQLAITPQLKEIQKRIEDAREPEVRRAWIDRFFELSSCPQCESNLFMSQGEISCPSCNWGATTKDDGGFVIVVSRLPRITPRSVQVNITLLILTIITTTITGSMLWMGYQNESFGDSFMETMIIATTTPGFVAMGALFFSLPLMIILGTHELGHYFMSKHYGVNASLPFFIPIPPGVSVLGTMGAFISMREPMPNKKALFDIGIAGPIAGLIMAIPVTIIGFLLTEPVDHVYVAGHGPNVAIGFPLLYELLYRLVTPDGGLHPTAFAGWVGLFVTALNLLPAGQLDGGHVARALMGERSKYLSYTTLTIMIIVGTFLYPAWLILGILIMVIGAYHPPPLNDLADLDMKRKAMGVFSIVLLVLCFTPQPLVPLEYDLNVLTPETEADINPNGTVIFTFFVENTGQINNTYDITSGTIPPNWNLTLSRDNVSLEPKDDEPEHSKAEIVVSIKAPLNATPLTDVLIKIEVTSQNASSGTFSSNTPKETITYMIHVKDPYDLLIVTPDQEVIIPSDSGNTTRVTVWNKGLLSLEARIFAFFGDENSTGWDLTMTNTSLSLEPETAGIVDLNITAQGIENGTSMVITIIAMSTTPLGEILEYGMISAVYLEEGDEEGRN